MAHGRTESARVFSAITSYATTTRFSYLLQLQQQQQQRRRPLRQQQHRLRCQRQHQHRQPPQLPSRRPEVGCQRRAHKTRALWRIAGAASVFFSSRLLLNSDLPPCSTTGNRLGPSLRALPPAHRKVVSGRLQRRCSLGIRCSRRLTARLKVLLAIQTS